MEEAPQRHFNRNKRPLKYVRYQHVAKPAPTLIQAGVDLLFGLETLRPTFPELEHFSLLLREFHDMGAFALVLHARELVARLGGLRLTDVRRRYRAHDAFSVGYDRL